MNAIVRPTPVSVLLRQLPGPLLRALDAWSGRVARRRWEERQRKWQQRKDAAAAALTDSTIPYQLRPWRD